MKFEEINEIMREIEKGHWPDEPVIPVEKPFENSAGAIWNLVWGAFASGSAISSKAGSVRSNHYHKTDSHFIYVVSGLMQYYWRPTGSTATPMRRRCPTGTLIFTPPMVEHATYFPRETFVITFNRRTRDHQSHEDDLVRIPAIVTDEGCPAVFAGHHCVLPYQHVEGRDFQNPVHAGQHETIDGLNFDFKIFG